MKGDFSRNTFKAERRYASVRMQQGRVQVDSDWNEQIDIERRRDELAAWDIIGGCGGPIEGGGFEIASSGSSLTVSEGRYYVQGAQVQNFETVDVASQPDLPGFELPEADGTYLAYLETWEWHLTALSDDGIREKALGGPDTATRTKRVWQVKFLPAQADDPATLCLEDLPAWNAVTAPSSLKLAAQAPQTPGSDRPCIVDPEAGFRRLENQLYRVEYHGQIGGTRYFKWSRENGSIVTAWTGKSGNTLQVADTGRDRNLSFKNGDWVELIDDGFELRGEPGTIVKLGDVADGSMPIVDTEGGTQNFADFPTNPRVRRWDMRDGLVALDTNFIPLEDGVEVAFQLGNARPGDYWMIPARVATGDVEWPEDNTGNALFVEPHGVERKFCRLAVVQKSGNTWTVLHDCRNLFPPLTAMAQLEYVSGDGQEAMPNVFNGSVLVPLPAPLQAAVVKGNIPVEGAVVRFTVRSGNGRLDGANTTVDVPTDDKGLAIINWSIDSVTDPQMVEAELVDVLGNRMGAPIRYVATHSKASDVAYTPGACPTLEGATTVQQAIDMLCKMGGGCERTVGKGGDFETLEEAIKLLVYERREFAIKLCLLPGNHEVKEDIVLDGDKETGVQYLEIHGFGDSSVVHMGNNRIILNRIREVRFDNFGITSSASDRAIFLRQISETLIQDVGVVCDSDKPTIPIYADRIATFRMIRSGLLNVNRNKEAPIREIAKVMKVEDHSDLYHVRGMASEHVEELSLGLANGTPARKKAAATSFRKLGEMHKDIKWLSDVYFNLAENLAKGDSDNAGMVALFVSFAIRQSLYWSTNPVLVIEESTRDVDIEQCELGGLVVIGGAPGEGLTADEVQSLSNMQTKIPIAVQGRGFYRFENNLMVRLEPGKNTFDAIRNPKTSDIGGFESGVRPGATAARITLPGVWSLHVVDNHLLDSRNVIVGENVAVRGNLFYGLGLSAVAIGVLGTFLGNHGPLESKLRNLTFSVNPPAGINTGIDVI